MSTIDNKSRKLTYPAYKEIFLNSIDSVDPEG